MASNNQAPQGRADIYRGMSESQFRECAGRLLHPRDTKRVPTNVHPLVDNVWEWLRCSAQFPSRRNSVFAAPSVELARQSAQNAEIVARVEFCGAFNAVEVNCEDAKHHPDVKRLPQVFKDVVGQDWFDGDLQSKGNLGRLFFPVLDQNEVDRVLREHKKLAKAFKTTSTFWQDCTPFTLDTATVSGEVFFRADDGYRLIEVADGR